MNISSKSLFIFSIFFLANQTLMFGMDTTKPLNKQSMEEGYTPSYFSKEISTTSKKNPKQSIKLYFRQYTKLINYKNISWFKHIYKTKEKPN